MKSKKPKSGKGERRRAIKPEEAWAAVRVWRTGEEPYIIARSCRLCEGDTAAIAATLDRVPQSEVIVIRVRIVPLNPKRKAK